MVIWKDIHGYEGYYQVNNIGDVRSVDRIVSGMVVKQRVLKKWKDRKAYFVVALWMNNNREIKRVHRLVADAFIDNPQKFPFINHKNENKEDNQIENLEWCTHKYNVRYGTGIARMAEHKKKPVLQISKSGEIIKKWESAKEAHRALGVDDSSIAKAARGKVKSVGGYCWKYA